MDAINIPITATLGGLKNNLNQAYRDVENFATTSNNLVGDIPIRLRTRTLQNDIRTAERSIKELSRTNVPIQIPVSLSSRGNSVAKSVKQTRDGIQNVFKNTIGSIDWTIPIETRIDNLGETLKAIDFKKEVSDTFTEAFAALDAATVGIEEYVFDVPFEVKLQRIDQATEDLDRFLFDTDFDGKVAAASNAAKRARMEIDNVTSSISSKIDEIPIPLSLDPTKLKQNFANIPEELSRMAGKTKTLPLVQLRLEEAGFFKQIDKVNEALNTTKTFAQNVGTLGVNKALSVAGDGLDGAAFYAEYLNPKLLLDSKTQGVFFKRVQETLTSPFQSAKGPLSQSLDQIKTTIGFKMGQIDDVLANVLVKVPAFIDNPDQGLYPILQPMLQSVENFADQIEKRRLKPFNIGEFFDQNVSQKAPGVLKNIRDSIRTESELIGKDVAKIKGFFSETWDSYNKSYTGSAINDAFSTLANSTGINLSESNNILKKQLEQIPASIKKITDQSEALPLIKMRLDETGIFDQLKKGSSNASGFLTDLLNSTTQKLQSLKAYLDPELFFDDNTRGVFFRRVHQVFISPFESLQSPLQKSIAKVGDVIVSGVKGTDKLLAKGLIKIPDLIDNPDKGLYPILQPMLQSVIKFSEEVKRIRTTPFDRKTFFDETIPQFADTWMNKIGTAISKGREKVERQGRILNVSFKKINRDYNRSFTGQAINDAIFKFGDNTGLLSGFQTSATAIKSLYANTTEYIVSRLAIVGKAQKGMESQATFTFYKTILSDIGNLMVKAFTPGSAIRRTTASASLAGAAFTGVSKSVKGVYNNTALVGNSLGKLVRNIFDFKNNLEGAVTATVFLFQKISANFWVQQLTPLGDIQNYLVMGLIPNLGTIMQMMGILNKYSAGPLLMQARYANVVRQLAIAEKVLTGMTLRSGQAVASFKGLGLIMKSIVVPAKLQVALNDMVMTLQMFNMQLQTAIMGTLALGDSIVASAESLLGGQGFLMPGVLPLGPTATTMFQIDQGIESSINYDQMTKQLQTVTGAAGATRDEINALLQSVLKMGGDTALTFQQITDGVTEMAVGAYSIDDIKNNFMALSESAQATGVELRDVVGSVQSVATAYNLDNLGETGQLLARVSVMTGTSIAEISKAMVDLKGVSLSTKTEFSDLVSFVATLTDATGRFSSQSVSTIQSVYSELEKITNNKPGSDENLSILERLGIARSDFEIAPGMLKPIDDIILLFRQKIAKATEENPNAHNIVAQWLSGNGITNSNSVMQSLTALGVGSDVEELKGSLAEVRNELSSSSEFIKQKAEEQNNTFTGQLQRLVNATFAVSASVGKMFQPLFQVWVDGALGIANWFNKLGDGLQKFGISLQALIPVLIVYFKFWILHKRVVDMLGFSYKILTSLITQQGRAEFVKNLVSDLNGLKIKAKEVGETVLGLFSGRVAIKDALQDSFNFIGKMGKANMDEFIGTTMFATKQLLAPVDAIGRWAGGLTRVNVSMKPVIESLASMSKKMLEMAKAGAEFATWQAVGLAGDIKKKTSNVEVKKENIQNAYKMAMGYGADTMPKIDGKTVYENMNFMQNMALLAVQIGLVTAAWYTLTELFKRSEGAKIAEETKKLNKELQETYKISGLIAKDKSFTEKSKDVLSGVGAGFGKIREFYNQIDILTPLEKQLDKFEQSLLKTKKKDFTPKIAPIEQEISIKQAGKAVLDLYLDARKNAGGKTKAVDSTNLQLGAASIDKANTQDFTNKLNLLIVKSFVIQKSNAIQKWASGVKDEVAIGLVKGGKATIGFIKGIKEFVTEAESNIGKFKDRVVTGTIDAFKSLYEGIETYIERIKKVGFIEASREALSSDPKSSFGTDASISTYDIANGIGVATASITGIIMAATVLGVTLNPLGLIIAGLASAFIGLAGAMKGAFKTAEQVGNIFSMQAKDELLNTTDLALESSQGFLSKYGIANKSDLAKAKERLSPEQKKEIEVGAPEHIANLQSAITNLEKTKSGSEEEKEMTEVRIRLYKDEVNRLRHREGVIKGTIAINEKLVYSYKELNDEIAKMNYARELENSFKNAKYEKELAEGPTHSTKGIELSEEERIKQRNDKLINGDRIIAKERAKMRDEEIMGNIKALEEEKRKLTERTQYKPNSEEEIKEYDAAKKRLFDIDLEFNRQVVDLAKGRQEELKRLSQERVEDEIAKFNQLNAALKLQTTQKEITNEFSFGVGEMDKEEYGDNQSNIKVESLFAEKKLLEDELKSYIQLNQNKDLSDKDFAQKKIDLEQKISDTTLQIIQERNNKELELTLRNIRVIAAEKTLALQKEARNKEFEENDLSRKSEITSVSSDIDALKLDRSQKHLEYQIQIAELMKDETRVIQLKDQLYASQLQMKQAEIKAEKELLAIQTKSKLLAAERAAIESELAVVEAESALSEAVANKETGDVISRLEAELSYKKRLVENSYQNIASTKELALLEEEKLKIAGENEIATINESHAVEKLRQKIDQEAKALEESTEAMEKGTKASEDMKEETDLVAEALERINNELSKQEVAYKKIEMAKKIANKEKLLGLVGTGGFDLASTLMDNEESLASLNNQIASLQYKLEEISKLPLAKNSEELLNVEKELNDAILDKRLTLLNQEIELKKQIVTESQTQMRIMEQEMAMAEAKQTLDQALAENAKARSDANLKRLEGEKAAVDKIVSSLEGSGNSDALLRALGKQEKIQGQIDGEKSTSLQEQIRLSEAELDLEQKKERLAAEKQRMELRNELLQAKEQATVASGSGNSLALDVSRQKVEIANKELSIFEEQETLLEKARQTRKETLAIENQSAVEQEATNQKMEKRQRQQEKINILAKQEADERERQQKRLQDILNLNKAIRDYRINALEKESSILDDVIGMQKELSNPDSEMPDTLRTELKKQMEAYKPGSSNQSEKSLYAERLKVEVRLAQERKQALLAEQEMERAMYGMEIKKVGLEMKTAELQAKLVAMQAKGTPLAREASAVANEASSAMDSFADPALEALRAKQAMERQNMDYENAKNVNQVRRQMAESGYTPEGDPVKITPSDFKVPSLQAMGESQNKINQSLGQFEQVGTALDTFKTSIEGLAQRIESIQSQPTNTPVQQGGISTTNTNTTNTISAGGINSTGPETVINVGSVSVISSDPTGDARKVLTDLAKARK